jgi:hypothetical protein
MRSRLSRRRFLNFTAAGLSAMTMPAVARAQTAVQPPSKPFEPDEYSVAAPVSIEVNARPLPAFDTRDRSRVRFGSLEYRSGLILTRRFMVLADCREYGSTPGASASSPSATRGAGSPAASSTRAAR